MAYLIDGHNLIPKLPGLSLRAIDDEMELVELLKAFCRLRRKPVEVFFDQAPPGFAGVRRLGPVTARFVAQGTTADEAIHRRLNQLGKNARNWIVVTSDHQVQADAHLAHATVITSEDFARQLIEVLSAGEAHPSEEKRMTPGEVDEWLDLFGKQEDH